MLTTAKKVMGAILGAVLALLCLLAIAGMVWWHFVRYAFKGEAQYQPPQPMREPQLGTVVPISTARKRQ